MSISENYEGSVTPIRSYISIFSRGTVDASIKAARLTLCDSELLLRLRANELHHPDKRLAESRNDPRPRDADDVGDPRPRDADDVRDPRPCYADDFRDPYPGCTGPGARPPRAALVVAVVPCLGAFV